MSEQEIKAKSFLEEKYADAMRMASGRAKPQTTVEETQAKWTTVIVDSEKRSVQLVESDLPRDKPRIRRT